MERTLPKIMLTILTAAATALTSAAQSDSLPKIPLYDNVISDEDAPGADDARPHENAKPSDSTIMAPRRVGEQLRVLANVYSAGKYNDALRLSENLRDNSKMTKEENLYRQIHTIAAYKDMEYNEEADSVTKLFLKKYPFYTPASYDPVSFKENLGNYYTMPRFSAWIGAGTAGAIPQLDTVHVIADTITPEPTYDLNDVSGFVFQVGFEYHILKYLSVSIAPTFMRYKYARETARSRMTTFRYEETDNMLTLPMQVNASLCTKREKWVPSLFVGAKAKYITKSKYAAYTQTIGEAQYTASKRKLDLDEKNRTNLALLGGLTLHYNYRRTTFFGEAGISYDLKPFNKPGGSLSNSDLVFDKMYVSDSFHMMELTFVVGVKVNFFYKTAARYGYGY